MFYEFSGQLVFGLFFRPNDGFNYSSKIVSIHIPNLLNNKIKFFFSNKGIFTKIWGHPAQAQLTQHLFPKIK